MINYKQLGEDLYKRRGEGKKKISIVTASKELGLSVTIISNIENGVEADYKFSTILKIVRYIGKDINDYLK